MGLLFDRTVAVIWHVVWEIASDKMINNYIFVYKLTCSLRKIVITKQDKLKKSNWIIFTVRPVVFGFWAYKVTGQTESPLI